MMKRYQISFGEEEAKRLETLAKLRGIPTSTMIRELTLRNFKEVEAFWGIKDG